jgi:hypothetical protein
VRVKRQRARDAAAQRVMQDEIQRPQIGQLVAFHLPKDEPREMRGDAGGGYVLAQEGVIAGIVGDDRDVGDVALVAGAGMGEGAQGQHVSISTAGATCVRGISVHTTELRCDLIGVDAVHRGAGVSHAEPAEVRLRVAGRTASMADAVRLANEVETLYINGPAGGGGASKSAREVLAVVSTLIPRTQVAPAVEMLTC